MCPFLPARACAARVFVTDGRPHGPSAFPGAVVLVERIVNSRNIIRDNRGSSSSYSHWEFGNRIRAQSHSRLRTYVRVNMTMSATTHRVLARVSVRPRCRSRCRRGNVSWADGGHHLVDVLCIRFVGFCAVVGGQ